MLEKIVSGITATGKLTLGNYIGSIKNMIKLQNDYEQYIFVADLHALTTYIDPKELMENKKNIFALYLACGLDPQKTTLFFQSDVPAHSELNWIITTITNMGELSRMTQFKDKSQNIVKQDNKTEIIPTGLFVYPALMIADIILYNPKAVPVGIDQKQHLELCQKIVKRMNTKYHLNFNEPKPIIPKIGNKIKSLVNPEQKISKFASLKDISIEEAEKHFSNKTYKDLKEEVGLVVKQFLIKIQKKYQSYIQNIDEIAQAGAKKANKIASENLLIIQKAFGLK